MIQRLRAGRAAARQSADCAGCRDTIGPVPGVIKTPQLKCVVLALSRYAELQIAQGACVDRAAGNVRCDAAGSGTLAWLTCPGAARSSLAAGTGIGRQFTESLAQAGADVVICGRRPGPVEQAAAEITALGGGTVSGGRVVTCRCTQVVTTVIRARAARRVLLTTRVICRRRAAGTGGRARHRGLCRRRRPAMPRPAAGTGRRWRHGACPTRCAPPARSFPSRRCRPGR